MRLPFSIALLSGALTACAVGPEYKRPAVPLTPAYAAPARVEAADPQWWHRFDDPVLDRVVDAVLAQNLDLAAAAARIEQARAAARSANAQLLPRLDADASAETISQSRQTPFGAASARLGLPRGYDLYQTGVQASWEIDMFGRLTRERAAARAMLAGSRADEAGVRLSVVSETVDAYLQLRGLQARLAVAEGQLAIRGRLVAIVRARVAEGLSAEQELNRSIGEQQGVAATIPALRAAIAGQVNRLDVLMGRQAGIGNDDLVARRDIPAAPDPTGSPLPADLIRRRPDIVAAESRLIAANARIGAAMAEYYPHVSLGGLLSTATVGGASLFTGNAVEASAGAALRWRLFDFGRIDAEVAQARGAEHEALAQYRASVLHATEDVETALTGLTEGRVQLDRLHEQVATLTVARQQSQIAYQAGAVALLDVLDADRALLDASDRLEQARAGVARASVAAVRALGGGYETKDDDHG